MREPSRGSEDSTKANRLRPAEPCVHCAGCSSSTRRVGVGRKNLGGGAMPNDVRGLARSQGLVGVLWPIVGAALWGSFALLDIHLSFSSGGYSRWDLEAIGLMAIVVVSMVVVRFLARASLAAPTRMLRHGVCAILILVSLHEARADIQSMRTAASFGFGAGRPLWFIGLRTLTLWMPTIVSLRSSLGTGHART